MASADEFEHQRVLRLGSLSDKERGRVTEAFEYLSPGDSLPIITKKPAGRLIAGLKVLYGTSFYWWPLERGPFIWRATLAKPALPVPTIAALMTADHLRLCELWSDFECAAELCQLDVIRRRSVELSVGLRRYIDIEEALLFPVLEGQTQMTAASFTGPMRTEHREIGRIIDELDKRHTTNHCPTMLEMFDRSAAAMTLFQRHCRREEATIYPFVEMVFSPAEERELLSLLQEFEI